MPGLIIRGQHPEVSFVVIWERDGLVGLKTHAADAGQIGKWHQYVDQVAPAEDKSVRVTRRELAQLLTQSGLMKGARRTPFGLDLAEHLMTDSRADSPFLMNRCILESENGDKALHLSYKRISETSWCLGDGAVISDAPREFNRMMDLCTSRMAHLAKESNLNCRYVTCLWHSSVKSTGFWAEQLMNSSGCNVVDALQCSISKWFAFQIECSSVKLKSLNSLTSDSRRRVMLQFSPMLYEAFAGLDGTHPILNSELGKMGPHHRALTKVALDLNETAIIAHRIITHNVWSTTGVTNSVFVLVPRGVMMESLAPALTAISQDEISYGTDDFLLIFDGETDSCLAYESQLPSPKRFSFLIHDLLLNEELGYHDERSPAKPHT